MESVEVWNTVEKRSRGSGDGGMAGWQSRGLAWSVDGQQFNASDRCHATVILNTITVRSIERSYLHFGRKSHRLCLQSRDNLLPPRTFSTHVQSTFVFRTFSVLDLNQTSNGAKRADVPPPANPQTNLEFAKWSDVVDTITGCYSRRRILLS